MLKHCKAVGEADKPIHQQNEAHHAQRTRKVNPQNEIIFSNS
jgi:hypothetical protein